MQVSPRVSVVIPTFGRPELVVRALRSVLAQTMADLEVIVVVDGPDPATGQALAAVDDARLRVIELPEKGGAQNARNTGVRAAAAPWTAMLDDDDEWLPEKLAKQLAAAEAAGAQRPIVASRLLNRTPRAEYAMPRRLRQPGEPWSEYFTVRRGLFHGEGFIQTSTIMAPTEVLRQVPFAPKVPRMQELDWTLRALAVGGTELVYVAEPLVIWYQDENRPRISFEAKWQQSLDWLRRNESLVTPKAYAAIVMSVVSSMAAQTHSPKVFWLLLREARRKGRPGFIDYVTFLQIWLIPPGLRRTLRDKALSRAPRPQAELV
ncbi:MAG: glycosyltransferase [Hamadaea sp.]|uniref:glycosyltransferase family 2 protein n=1 Tax=Hamadaea sp. TaxID=2024425 RepID=UPI0017F2EE66|nr:glycosyltransferase [Hamadaea sp.]NUR72341.1 glycosyltransferase [Hamadaea sp.]NUT18448.1 glycosyltransferase [Hamadaea sp.]